VVVIQENPKYIVRYRLAESHHFPRLGAALVTDIPARWLEAGHEMITVIPCGIFALDTTNGVVDIPPRFPPRDATSAPVAHQVFEVGRVLHRYITLALEILGVVNTLFITSVNFKKHAHTLTHSSSSSSTTSASSSSGLMGLTALILNI
jgi:hypothetical protein